MEQINGPEDLKKLTAAELKELAGEIRQFILDSVSRTGGHLASNLGVVELTLALHYVFDFQNDRLLWDVGHQCYTHKIITSRKELFRRLRQPDGLSGFPSPAESVYDSFFVGHAGTAAATAIGMALGKALKQKNNRVVAVVGDASIVNGLSLEALNNLGLVKRQLLIILNDNSMAIDATQGAVAKYFSKMRLSQKYEDLRARTNNLLEHLPLGKGMEDAIERIKKTIRMTIPGSQMFEGMNIPYFGPVDGHDIESLIQVFLRLERFNRPVILHVHTKKGEGFAPAGQDPSKFHSTGPFELNGDTGESDTILPGQSFTKVFGEHLVKLAEQDSDIVAITSAMCDGTGLSEFREKFPTRFFDVGIAEEAAVDIAAGLAKSGCKPVVCIYSTFLQRSFDEIFQEVALQNLPVVFCIDRAGFVGADGPTHHGLMDIGFMRMMPNMILISPANDVEMKLALDFAFTANRPVVIRYPKDIAVATDNADIIGQCNVPFELGKSVTVKSSPNSKVFIISYGSVLTEAVKAAKLLNHDGVEADVINARFAEPIDDKIISLVSSGKNAIIIEDHATACGFGSAVLEAAVTMPKSKRGAIRIIGSPKQFIGHNSRKVQLMQIGINADKIANTAKELITNG